MEISKEEAQKHILKSKFAVATIHDISPKYTDKVFQLADELEKLNIKFNFAVIPWYNKQQEYDIRKNSKFVKRILNYNQPVALHGLYHESGGKIEHFNDFSFE